MSPAMRPSSDQLKRGWTTGACATAATRAAFTALLTGEFPDPVEIVLPKGQTPSFALAAEGKGEGWAQAGIVKDAGDDPDVTHGALVRATIAGGPSGSGITFVAGPGVGTVTKPGLPVAVGEPAVNPVPRQLMESVIAEQAALLDGPSDVTLTLGIENGAELAQKTWNPRLGIVGGLSILGTTGVVHPFSCSAWIHSIHRGVDVARAAGLTHLVGATGSTSEATAQNHFALPDQAMIDMGDFAGGLLKYVRFHPVPRVTIAGGFAKICKLANGRMDLHSGRSQVDFDWLAGQLKDLNAPNDLQELTANANTALEVLAASQVAGIDLPSRVAELAQHQAQKVVKSAEIQLGILIIDRAGKILAERNG